MSQEPVREAPPAETEVRTGTTRLEAFSDGMFAIILTILVLELHVPAFKDVSFAAFLAGMAPLVPKLLSFVFSFFMLAIFWVNHHHIVHHIAAADAKLLWLNIAFLFFACLFPFLTAMIGDNPGNPWVVALFPLNMACDAFVLRALWKHAFVDTDLGQSDLTVDQKRTRLRTDSIAGLVNIGAAGLAFVWIPLTLVFLVAMPLLFVVPSLVGPRARHNVTKR